MTDLEREDAKRIIQFGLALVGGAAVLGSLVGAVYGLARDVVACVCCEEGASE